MASIDAGAEGHAPSVPSMLDLVRLSSKRLFPPGGVELYRQIALLTEMSPDHEVLDVAAGKGVPLEYFASEFGATASGVELDPDMVEEAERWTRELQASDRMQFQTGRSDALPYRDEIFDIAIGEIGLSNHCDPEDAVRELVRVTKPGGFVVLVQLVWKAPVDEERRAVLSKHLGARPLMVVEWKRLLREAGVEDVHVEDWSDEETSFRSKVVKPFPDVAELFSLPERLVILKRAWKKWGWRGVSSALAREQAVHKLLTNERILGLDLLRGRKEEGLDGNAEEVRGEEGTEEARATGVPVVPAIDGASAEQDEREEADEALDPVGAAREGADREDDEEAETAGLPLFGGDTVPTEPNP